jgi:lysine 2,3-aminomutase
MTNHLDRATTQPANAPASTALAPQKTLRSAADLVAAGLAAPHEQEQLEKVAARYAVAITPDMARLIAREQSGDPIARQFVPQAAELTITPDERADPIGDRAHSPLPDIAPGLVHRYPDRVLLKLVHVCPVYCRFCFRRETVGPDGAGGMTPAAFAAALAYIRARPQIWEVILTGGDPFMLSARRAAEITRSLADISHVKVLRWHTRVPVVDPGRVSPGFVAALRCKGVATYVAIHANHPRELTPEALAAIGRLADAGIVLLSQTVLLRGVNDDAGVLAGLMRAFVAARVKPYYLHHPDLAPGTSHFRVSIAEGQALMRQLRGRVSGLCQPTYVLDIPDGHGKVPVGPSYLTPDDVPFVDMDGADGGHPLRVLDSAGRVHAYPPRPRSLSE